MHMQLCLWEYYLQSTSFAANIECIH
jgi:hypothetical protein